MACAGGGRDEEEGRKKNSDVAQRNIKKKEGRKERKVAREISRASGW